MYVKPGQDHLKVEIVPDLSDAILVLAYPGAEERNSWALRFSVMLSASRSSSVSALRAVAFIE